MKLYDIKWYYMSKIIYGKAILKSKLLIFFNLKNPFWKAFVELTTNKNKFFYTTQCQFSTVKITSHYKFFLVELFFWLNRKPDFMLLCNESMCVLCQLYLLYMMKHINWMFKNHKITRDGNISLFFPFPPSPATKYPKQV